MKVGYPREATRQSLCRQLSIFPPPSCGDGRLVQGPIRHLYFHIPFCPKLCPYCCFFVEVGSKHKNQRFLDALLREVEAALERHAIAPTTIYFGGGTPSALLAPQLEFLLGALRERLDFSALEEFTLEANPATIQPEKARVLREGGVTRLSLGVQSWDDGLLKTLGRAHTAQQAEKTVALLRQAGFDDLNIDLMFSIPGQTREQWAATLDRTIALAPRHISAYCLTYEEDTEYFRRLLGGDFIRDDERDADLFEMTIDRLGSAGFLHYEISNYARPGAESRHNQACWQGADYLGFGPGAFSTVGLERWENVRDTAQYQRRIFAGEPAAEFRERLTPRMRQGEIAAFGLRTALGMAAADLEPWRPALASYFEHGLLVREAGRIRLTEKGKLLADTVAEVFV
jgi:oxygen-independent coproporphyrinogen-3 oxidase